MIIEWLSPAVRSPGHSGGLRAATTARSVGFAVRPYHALVLCLVSAPIACTEGSDTTSDPYDYISFHWPAAQPRPDARTCVLLNTGEQIQLDPEKIIGTEHFARAFVSEEDDFVTVELTDVGRELLARATAGRVGDRMAIVVADTIVAMPTINAPLDVPHIPLMPQRSVADAQRVARDLNEAIAARQVPQNL